MPVATCLAVHERRNDGSGDASSIRDDLDQHFVVLDAT